MPIVTQRQPYPIFQQLHGRIGIYVLDELPLALPPRLRPGRRVHHAHQPGRSGRQRPGHPAPGRGLRPPGRGAGGVPGTRHLRLRHQRPAATGRPARRRRGRDRHAWSRRRPTCCRCCWSARRCATWARSTTAPWRSIAASCWAWCRKSTCRTTASSTSRAISCPATAPPARSPSPAAASRSAPTCCSPPRICLASIVHVEICEDVWVPIPPSGEAALAGATVLANLSASNITIGKADTRRLLCRSQSARCLAAYLYAAAGAGESTTDLAWDGQASVFENGATLAETERFPADHAAAIADIDLDLLRAGAAADGLVRRQPPALRGAPVPHRDVPAGPAGRRCRLPPPGRAFPVRPGRPRAAGTGLLRGVQHPGLRPDAAAARHRHQAGGDRRVGRAGFHPGADRLRPGVRPAGTAAGGHPRLHHARLRHLRPDQAQRGGADAGAGRDGGGTRHPPGGEPDAGGHPPPVRRRASRSTT